MYGTDMHPKHHCEVTVDGLSGIERLLAIEQIKRTKAFYCFSMDAKDWDGYQNVFTTDAVLEVPSHGMGDKAERIEGQAAIRRHVEGAVGNVVTTHQCHTPIIDFTSATTAAVVWAMEDMLRFPEGGPAKQLHGMGHYFEKYRRMADGSWRIAHVRLTRLRLDVVPF
jgi:ketosteroid isomerase-like protein